MTTLFVITKSEQGGAQQHVLDLATGCVTVGDRVTVALGEPAGWLVDHLSEHKIPVVPVRLKRSWNPFVFFFYFVDLFRTIRRTQPEVVHFHSSHTLLGTWIVRLLFPRIRSVVTIHGLSVLYPGISKPIIRFVYAFFLRVAMVCADGIIFVCRFDHDVFQTLGLFKHKQSHVIYNGLDEPLFLSREDALSRLGIAQDALVIGTLGRFRFPKHVDLLIEAVALMDRPNVVLCLIGEGPEENALKLLVQRKGITQRTVFAKGDASFLKAFDLFVLSSRYEGFPYVLLEAAWAEVPIVATHVGGVSELIEQNKTGHLVPAGLVTELRTACEDVLNHPEHARKMAEEAKRRVQTFTKHQMVEETRAMYRLL